MKKFEEMEFSEQIKKSIRNMGFTDMTLIQEKTIPHILNNEDVIALAHTGSGKTVAFGVGVIESVDSKLNEVQVLILCPTRELAIQTSSVITELSKHKEGVRILSIYGGQNIQRQILLLKKRPQIIIGTPGRIIDHINRRTIRLSGLKMLVLDEADEMLDMGFKDDLDIILKSSNQKRQTLLFSATMSNDIKKIAKEYLKEEITIKIADDMNLVPKIDQYFITTKDSRDKDAILKKIIDQTTDISIVFCNTKRKVDQLKKTLSPSSSLVESLHGDMRQNQRDRVMKMFRERKIKVLITTDVAARGIDVKNVEKVINYDLPNDTKYYIHRIGRTGRAGKNGVSITFALPSDKYKLKSLEKESGTPIREYPDIKSSTPIREYSDIKSSFKSHSETTRIFISLGKLDGITGTKLVKFLIEQSKLKENDFTNIEVFEKFSFFNVDSKLLSKVIKLDGTKYNQRKIGVEVSSKPR